MSTIEILAKEREEKLAATTQARKVYERAEPVDFSHFWHDEDNNALIPAYPLKPFLEIKFLSAARKPSETDPTDTGLDYEDIFVIPFNYITNFSINTYPYARAKISLSDTEFVNIEGLALRALTLYNETIMKVQQGKWERGPLSVPGFCKLRWGWSGKTQPITSDWLTFILIGFKYNITQTWLTVDLELIGNSQYFFDVTKLGLGKNHKVCPKKNGEDSTDNDEFKFKLYEYIETMLTRFGLTNGKHYIIKPEEFDHPIAVGKFKLSMSKFMASDTPLATFVIEACKLQLQAYAGKPDPKPTGIEIMLGKPDEASFNKYGLVKRWTVNLPAEEKDSNISRYYEWRNSPTSIIQSLDATVPEGYFLGYTSLNFLGYTLDDNGQVAMHIVQFKKGKVFTIDSIRDIKTTTQMNKEMAAGKLSANQITAIEERQAKLVQKPRQEVKKTEEYKTFMDKYGDLIKIDEKGMHIVTGTDTQRKEVHDAWKKIEKLDEEIRNENEELRKDKKEAKAATIKDWDDYIKEHSDFIPINIAQGGTEGMDLQTKEQQDKWLMENLLTTIANDMILTLRLTILGDPWLDGSQINLSTARIRVIVNRPDGKPSLLSNDYFFLPSGGLTHNISKSGYTTTMTLMTAKDIQEKANEVVSYSEGA